MSADVLADLAALRRRTRGDRHAYAFPLFLFGALILWAERSMLLAVVGGVVAVIWKRR
jgi:hypothetical protein